MDNTFRTVRLSRLSVWLILLLVLTATLLYNLLSVEKEAENTALMVTGTRILDVANHYKQHWLLNGQPNQIEIEGKQVTFNDKGWVLPTLNNEVDCLHWLSVLHPTISVFGNGAPVITQVNKDSGVDCQYQYKQGQRLNLLIDKSQFSVRVRVSLD
jgi:MSHA biogenesis protein MshF